MKYFQILILFSISLNSFSHSGGTDKNGCHAGSEPYHCHGSSSSGSSSSSSSSSSTNKDEQSKSEIKAWDLNFGYQHHFVKNKRHFFPYLGASLGEKAKHDSISLGVDLGLRLENYFYFGYVTTSESFYLGYKFAHISFKSDVIGVGVKYPFSFKTQYSNKSSLYTSGSLLFGEVEAED